MKNKIPDFNEHGYLPKGIYKVAIHQIQERFGKVSERRKELFGNFLAVTELVKKIRTTIIRFFLDGSFITAKEHPDDIDCMLIIGKSFDLESKEALKLYNSVELFNCDILFAEEDDEESIKTYMNLFSHDVNEVSKGLLEVIL